MWLVLFLNKLRTVYNLIMCHFPHCAFQESRHYEVHTSPFDAIDGYQGIGICSIPPSIFAEVFHRTLAETCLPGNKVPKKSHGRAVGTFSMGQSSAMYTTVRTV